LDQELNRQDAKHAKHAKHAKVTRFGLWLL
jgi:hypothetical protein